MITMTIDANKGRDIMGVDVTNAFIQKKMHHREKV